MIAFRHNGADDATLDAALVARALPGRRILLKWTREDEHAFEPLGPPMHIRLGAHLDDDGVVAAWSHDVYGFTHGRTGIGGARQRGIRGHGTARPRPAHDA